MDLKQRALSSTLYGSLIQCTNKLTLGSDESSEGVCLMKFTQNWDKP